MLTTTLIVWTPAIFYIIAALVVIAIFVGVWRMDAVRSERQAHDPQRLNVDPKNQPGHASQQLGYTGEDEYIGADDEEYPPPEAPLG